MSELMPELLSHFEQFLALFEKLKSVAGEPVRVATFYLQSSAIREAAENLESCALDLKYNLEWFGSKRPGPVSSRFEQVWDEYRENWAPAIAYGSFCYRLRESRNDIPYEPDMWRNAIKAPELEEPDPKLDEFFDPVRHDGGLALSLGVDHWRGEVHRAKVIANKCQIALDAFGHLRDTIGIDVADIFRRWREVPTIFVPPSVSNAHGEEAGSLGDLMDNAVRAYVCGAPAAAIAMCRAVVEIVVKDHYIPDSKDRVWTDRAGNQREKGLGDLIVLAEKRFEFLRTLKLAELKETGDEILHRYHRREPLSASDEKAIIDYMQSLKTLIQNVER